MYLAESRRSSNADAAVIETDHSGFILGLFLILAVDFVCAFLWLVLELNGW